MAKIFIGRAKNAQSFETDVADSFLSRLLGIMWQGTPLRKPFTRPLFFEFEREATVANATHSFFCFVPYDAVFIGSDWAVTEVMEAIPGWNPCIVPKMPFKYLIEMPSRQAARHGIKPGVKVTVRY
jgi:uncharacterized membrane protein (UPF0127 family)